MRSVKVLTVLAAQAILPVFAAPPRTIVLEVQNMTCPVCPVTVKKSLEQVPGVEKVTIDFGSKTAVVEFDPDRTAPEVLIEATTEAGFPSAVQE